MGLDYYGHGRYGKDGKVTHRSVHDRLVDMNKFSKNKEENKTTSSPVKSKPKSTEPKNLLDKLKKMAKKPYKPDTSIRVPIGINNNRED